VRNRAVKSCSNVTNIYLVNKIIKPVGPFFRHITAPEVTKPFQGFQTVKTNPHLRTWSVAFGLGLAAGIAALIAGCTSTPLPPPVAPAPIFTPPAPPPPAPVVIAPPMTNALVSSAATPRDYRRDAANHLYGKNKNRIYKGMMPPLLYAIGVLQVEVDGQGRVTSLSWMRAPTHAPEVIAEIERTVRQAAPYPMPTRMGRVTYTDTWLWHKSGLFQLDTLTEGQL
jgi:hypothetical protein